MFFMHALTILSLWHCREGRRKQNLRCVRYDISGQSRVLLIAIRDIAKGERLYYDYNAYHKEYPTQHFVWSQAFKIAALVASNSKLLFLFPNQDIGGNVFFINSTCKLAHKASHWYQLSVLKKKFWSYIFQKFSCYFLSPLSFRVSSSFEWMD